MSGRRLSIRTSVVVGVLLIAAPFLGLLTYQAYDRVDSARQATNSLALGRASTVAADVARFVDGTRVELAALAHRPSIVALDPAGCDHVVADATAFEPAYANLYLADRSGRVVCSAESQLDGPVSIVDRPYFQRTMATDAFTVGNAQLGRITGRWVAALAMPVHDSAGRVVGVVAATVDLVTFGSIVVERPTSPSSVTTVVDGAGIVLTRLPDAASWTGKSVGGTGIGLIVMAAGQGTAQATGPDGIERLYGYTTVPNTDWHVYAGLSTAEAFAHVRENFARAVLLILLALLLAFALAVQASRMIARPVRALADAAQAAAQGDFATRVQASGFAETAVLADRFNAMLELRGTADAAMRASDERLRMSERSLAEAQRIAHIGSWGWEAATDTSRWSDETCAIYGIEPGTFDGRDETFMAFVHPDDRERLRAVVQAALDEDAPLSLDLRILRRDGAQRTIHEDGEVIRDGAGNVLRLVGTISDITDRLAREDERTRLLSAVEQTADSVWIHELDGTIVYVNPSFTRLYDYQPDEVLGRYMGILDSGRHETSFWDELFATVLAGQTWSGHIVNQRKDGTLVEVEKVISAIRDADGRITGVVQSDRDVTRERALEAQLRQAQKMEAVGQLAGGIAHDFNNLLTAIRGYAEMVRRGLPPDDEQNRADIDEVIANADRAVELTRDLLAFGRRQVLQPRVTDLAAVVVGIAPMLRRLLGEQIEVVTAAQPGLGSVQVDPGQLEQVIVNLAVNARDAMPTGGRLVIETANVELDAVYARAHIDIDAGSYVLLTVSDTGTGMDAAVQAHIFEPFFTTKAPGEGTGLGLATVYGIVQQSGGSIQVQSEPGQGTSFRIYLPRVEISSELAEPVLHEEPTTAGTETILLVEDEETVRLFAARALAECGYRVLEAPDAETALALAAAHDGPLHLLVTDVVMPRVTGPQLAELLAHERPLTRVLYISGYTKQELGRSGAFGQAIAYLAKPFTAEALAQTVRGVLERPADAEQVPS